MTDPNDPRDEARAAAWEISGRAGEFPHGACQIALHEEAIALADRHRDEDLGYDMRQQALWPCYHGKRPDLLLVHFAWCVAYHDARPHEPASNLLWNYRWVIDSMPWFDGIPLDTIRRTWEDMRTRYERAGASLRPVWLLKRRIDGKLGDAAGVKDANRRYRKCRRDFFADSEDTEAAFDVFYHAWLRQDRATLEAARPFLDGTYPDPHFLIGVYDTILMPLARSGRAEEAQAYQKKATRFMASRPELLGTADDHIEFLAVTEDFAAGARVFDRHFTAALEHPGRLDSLKTLQASKLLTARLLKAGRTRLSLRVGEGILPGHAGRVPIDVLDEWLARELPALATIADARNGNGYYTDKLNELDELNRLADALAAARPNQLD